MQGTASEDGDGRAGNDWASLEACRCSESVWYFAYLCPGGREAGRGYGVYDAGNWYFKYVGNDVPQMMKHIVSWINLVKNYIIHTIGNMRLVSAIRMVEMQGFFNYRIRPPYVLTVTTCHGMNFPLAWRARFVVFSIPSQHGTFMRTMVISLILLRRMIIVSFSE